MGFSSIGGRLANFGLADQVARTISLGVQANVVRAAWSGTGDLIEPLFFYDEGKHHRLRLTRTCQQIPSFKVQAQPKDGHNAGYYQTSTVKSRGE